MNSKGTLVVPGQRKKISLYQFFTALQGFLRYDKADSEPKQFFLTKFRLPPKEVPFHILLERYTICLPALLPTFIMTINICCRTFSRSGFVLSQCAFCILIQCPFAIKRIACEKIQFKFIIIMLN